MKASSSIASLTATDATPWVNVRVMAATMFCRRAGVLACELGDDSGEDDDDDTARLDYLPDYELAQIEAALEETWRSIHLFLRWAVFGLLILAGVGLSGHWGWSLLGALPSVFLFRWLFDRFRIVSVLARRRDIARRATAREPDLNGPPIQDFNWWELRKAGFEVVPVRESLRDDTLRLAGRPWRILQRGSLRIPVFRKHRGERQLRPQHRARLAAYGHLIEETEGLTAPFGVLMFADSYDVLVVMFTEPVRSEFHHGLTATRDLLSRFVLLRDDPGHPSEASVCKLCPLGRPVVHRPGQTDTKRGTTTLPAFRTRGVDGREYHSPCGDRFHWIPSHDRAREKKLIN
ncbi:MAG: hypothetical protein ACKV2Q_20455 [Planctomycetaceae bacterium]